MLECNWFVWKTIPYVSHILFGYFNVPIIFSTRWVNLSNRCWCIRIFEHIQKRRRKVRHKQLEAHIIPHNVHS
ncbi:unnamed protein product [Hermetia illucens]|uniref:Uncharacterized protein n=1 Tax=Hermetia illucens TaxID=343691 RepID=A0A7R8V7D0_HERIL|nr:unnamed protein product [Hermetia illucens]